MKELALPIRTDETAFHDMMAEQLRHAPWLVMSAAVHALALLLLWVMLPADAPKKAQNAIAMENLRDETPIPEPIKPEIQPVQPEDPQVVDPVLTPVETTEPTANDDGSAEDAGDTTGTLSAFDGSQWNPAVGIGGGDTGRGGPKGRGKPSGTGAPSYKAIRAGLEWLAAHQDADGRWDCDQFMKHDREGIPCDGPGSAVHDVGVTGLALLAFLGDGHTLRQGAYRDNVRQAVRWLRDQQDPSGRFGAAASSDFVYDHAIAAYAMCEAYGLSQYVTLMPVAQKGIDYLQAHRNPYGAWRYQPRDGDNDTSVTGWCIMALCSGEHWGLVVDRQALRIAEHFLESCTSPDGRCGYTRAGEPSARKPGDHAARFPIDKTEPLTAAGLFCRFFLGQLPKEKAVMQKAAERLVARLPVWDTKAGTIDHYYWYYGSYALYQIGGSAWREWSKAIDAAVVKTQRQDGNARGSWDPVDVWGDDGGRVYSTAILTLTLQAYYRYTRLVR